MYGGSPPISPSIDISSMKLNIEIDSQTSLILDVVRGVSAVIVMLSHVFQIFIVPKIGLSGFIDRIWTLLASYSVMAFFIISGFVISISIMRNVQRNGVFKEREFLIKRFNRLYPPLILSLVMIIGIFYLAQALNLHGSEAFYIQGDYEVIREKISLEWKPIFASLVFIQDIFPGLWSPSLNGALWSLSYEFWFYVIAMSVTSWIINKRLTWGGLLTIGVIIPIVYFNNVNFFTFLCTWGSGVFWALLYVRRKSLGQRIKVYTLPIFLGLLAILLIILAQNNFWPVLHPYRNFLTMSVQTLISWLGMLILLHVCLRLEGSSFKFLGANRLAPFSYTLYLIHFPLLLLGFSLTHEWIHDLGWIYNLIVGLLFGVVVIFISKSLAGWIEDKSLVRRIVQRMRVRFG
jgi:peptidoglycan/LPS O-acetylase OafA/YrhL